MVHLSKTTFKSKDSLFWERHQHNHLDDYYNIEKYTPTIKPKTKKNEKVLMQSQFFLSQHTTEVKRTTYNVFNLLSEGGGFMNIMSVVCRLSVAPFQQFLFILLMMKRLYFAKTKRDDVFMKPSTKRSNFIKFRLKRFLDHNNVPEELKQTGFKD